MTKQVTIDGEQFEEISGLSVKATNMIVDTYQKLGEPKDPYSKQGEKMMEVIIAVWEDLWPKEFERWKRQKKKYQDTEMDISEQVKKETGRSLLSIPLPVYHLMKKFFPTFKADNRDELMKLAKKYPYFKMAKKL